MYSIKSWIISIFTRKLVSEPAMEHFFSIFHSVNGFDSWHGYISVIWFGFLLKNICIWSLNKRSNNATHKKIKAIYWMENGKTWHVWYNDPKKPNLSFFYKYEANRVLLFEMQHVLTRENYFLKHIITIIQFYLLSWSD